jgi:hypothetical protein
MEDIQKELESKGFLSPRQIIEYMGGRFKVHDKHIGWEVFYDTITGVYGKEENPIPWDELNKQMHELRKRGINLSPFNGSDYWLAKDFGLPLGGHARFYLNAHDSAGRKQILESIVDEFGEKRGFKIKTVGTTKKGFTRYDNTVMYVNVNDAARYFDFMRRLPTEHAECFDDEVPLTTRKIGKGTGYAVSPLKDIFYVLGDPLKTTNESFNTLHSTILQRTFDKVRRDGIKDHDVIIFLYLRALTGVRFDLERPYLNLGMKDPLEVAAVEF